jgi:hypothetical protein
VKKDMSEEKHTLHPTTLHRLWLARVKIYAIVRRDLAKTCAGSATVLRSLYHYRS